jgi:two-component system cell cycle sensor histidine kinase/response regulator CckA
MHLTSMPPFGSNTTILVVDDEPAILNLIKSILEPAGFALLVASNAHQALGFLENRDYSIDLLLTDFNMPDINGVELACRACEIAPGLPVMFMTGCRKESPGLEFLMREGPFSECEVITKPFTPRGLLSEINGILSTTLR